MKNKNAFSFVELIIVISILSIITIFWVSSFSSQIDSLKLKSTLSKISGDIKDLDNKVNSKQIFDYEIEFIKEKKYFLVNENIFDLNNKLILSNYDEDTWIVELKIHTWSNSNSGTITIFSWYKFVKVETKNWNDTFTWAILKNIDAKFTWEYSWSILNNLYLQYFWNELKLIKIDANTSDLDWIKIKNVLWRKQFWDDDTINKIVLTFEDSLWRVETLELIK